MQKIKYLLFLFGFMLLMIPNVNAEEYDTCYDNYLVGTVTTSSSSAYFKRVNPNIPAKGSTTYYIRFFISEDFTSTNGTRFAGTPIGYDFDGNSLGYIYITDYSWDSNNYIFTFTTPANDSLSSLSMEVYTYQTNYTILEGAYFTISDNKDDLLTCSVVEEPEEPDEPIIPDTTLDGFYSIYLEKLTMFTNYALENKFILGSIVVIILFIILEIILNLFRKGGYR